MYVPGDGPGPRAPLLLAAEVLHHGPHAAAAAVLGARRGRGRLPPLVVVHVDHLSFVRGKLDAGFHVIGRLYLTRRREVLKATVTVCTMFGSYFGRVQRRTAWALSSARLQGYIVIAPCGLYTTA